MSDVLEACVSSINAGVLCMNIHCVYTARVCKCK